MTARIGRARPLSTDDRRAMIIDAAIPLLIEHGRGATSKQIAESAGIAEGTIFRAFGDKESLIIAAVEHYLDPTPLRKSIAAIDPELKLEVKVHSMVVLLRGHFSKLFRMAALFQEFRPPDKPGDRAGFTELFVRVIGDDAPRLNCTPAQVVHVVRLMTFSSSVPELNEEGLMSDEQITELVLNGIVGRSGFTPVDEKQRNLSDLVPAIH
jgi:AcrR family transcriptional regulator